MNKRKRKKGNEKKNYDRWQDRIGAYAKHQIKRR